MEYQINKNYLVIEYIITEQRLYCLINSNNLCIILIIFPSGITLGSGDRDKAEIGGKRYGSILYNTPIA